MARSGWVRWWVLAVLLFAAPPASAHPADEANVYHYLWIEARPGELELQHATIVGGLLTAAVWPDLDTDGDGVLSETEQLRSAQAVLPQLTLRIDGRSVKWKLVDHVFPSKEEFFGRNMAAITLRLRAALPKPTREGFLVSIKDETYPLFTAVFPQPRVEPSRLDAGKLLVSENGRLAEVRLAAEGALPAAEKEGRREGEPAGSDPLKAPDLENAPIFPDNKLKVVPPAEGPHNELEGLKDLLNRPLSPVLVILGLGAALLAGMAHALTPGHGKSMVAAYLVGTRGTAWDAVLLGIVVTITHTAGVYVLGFLCLWLTRQIRAEVVGQWLTITSGLLVLGMGFWLFQRSLLAYHGLKALPGHSHGAGGHTHEHGHSHVHGHAHEHGHAQGSDPETDRRPPRDAPMESYKDRRAERRGVILLGVAGGLVPCFDALAILIAAVNLRRVELGLALIAAFSVGMALVLVAIGVVMVKAKGLAERFSGEARWVKALPVFSGAVLTLLGAWLTFQALVAAGVLRIGA